MGEHLEAGSFQIYRTGRKAQNVPQDAMAVYCVRRALQQVPSERFDLVSGKQGLVHMLQ